MEHKFYKLEQMNKREANGADCKLWRAWLADPAIDRSDRSVAKAQTGADTGTQGVDSDMMEGKTMGWLWNGRGHRSRTRPRVASAVEAARLAHLSAQTTFGRMTPALSLGSAVVATERIGWAHAAPAPRNAAYETYQAEYADEYAEEYVASGGASGAIGALIERAEQTAHDLGRSRSQMWEEALRAWLETQGEEPHPAPRPWLFEARRQRTWGEIEQTLTSLRTA